MKYQDDHARLRAAALRLLRFRERSVTEMRERLCRKGFSREAIEVEIQTLKDEKLLDDERFTGVWIRHKLTISHKGKRLLRAELAAKGIDAEMFSRVWAEHVEMERESARAWALAHLKDTNLLESYERRGRIRQGLYRRGYSQEAIDDAMKEIT
ncbi:RecX family transcriptional regulator [candidate division WOR-3 bacterium]|nr:RecX family transcriptional regulator [candidate division WOR-3 bacterium]